MTPSSKQAHHPEWPERTPMHGDDGSLPRSQTRQVLSWEAVARSTGWLPPTRSSW